MRNKLASTLFWSLFAAAFLLTTWALWLVFMAVPNEQTMGAVQRIFYFHVGSALACYCSVLTLLVCSLLHLYRNSHQADIIAEAAAEVGFVFCTIVLFSGIIWAKSAWNTWFNWEPRLASFVILWLIFLSLGLLRAFGEPAKVSTHSAVLGVISALTVPLVILSVRLLPQSAQLHPQLIAGGGLKEPRFKEALYVSVLALISLQYMLTWLRARLGFARELLKVATR